MDGFTDDEKKRLLEAATSQTQLHTYLMGMNGQPGFCKLVEDRLEDMKLLEDDCVHLKSRVQWIIGVLVGLSIAFGGSIGISRFLGD